MKEDKEDKEDKMGALGGGGGATCEKKPSGSGKPFFLRQESTCLFTVLEPELEENFK